MTSSLYQGAPPTPPKARMFASSIPCTVKMQMPCFIMCVYKTYMESGLAPSVFSEHPISVVCTLFDSIYADDCAQFLFDAVKHTNRRDKTTCSTTDCSNYVAARGLCIKHGANGFCSIAGCSGGVRKVRVQRCHPFSPPPPRPYTGGDGAPNRYHPLSRSCLTPLFFCWADVRNIC